MTRLRPEAVEWVGSHEFSNHTVSKGNGSPSFGVVGVGRSVPWSGITVSHRERQGARLARREEGVHREYVTDEHLAGEAREADRAGCVQPGRVRNAAGRDASALECSRDSGTGHLAVKCLTCHFRLAWEERFEARYGFWQASWGQAVAH